MTREDFLTQCAEASYNYLGASGNVIGTEEDAFGEIYDRMKQEFTDKAAEWFRHQKEEIGLSWIDDFEIRFREFMEV